MEPSFEFMPLDHNISKQLAYHLMIDRMPTLYASKQELKIRILTVENIKGFVIKKKFFYRNQPDICGFALHTDNGITDMYMFEAGREENLYQKIVKHYLKLGWNGNFIIDHNNKKMEQIFLDALDKEKAAH